MLLVGLTGNFGMGKSYVLSVFKDLGAKVLKSDSIVGELLKDEKVKRKVLEIFGNEVLDSKDELDKPGIADKIFNDSRLRKKLEALLHPLVLREICDQVGRIKNQDRIVIVEVPLLFEGNYQRQFDKTITVYTTKKTAIERLIKSGFSCSQAVLRLKAQLPIAEKKKRSDYTINNNGSREKTRERTEKIFRLLVEEMKKRK